MNIEDEYVFNDADEAIVQATKRLLWKIVRSTLCNAEQVEIVARIIRIFDQLPILSESLNVTIDLSGPRRWYGEHEIWHWWQVDVNEHDIQVSSGGHFYRESTGGDTFTCMQWSACPEQETVYDNYLENLAIVDDAMAFEPEVDKIDLNESGYKLTVTAYGETIGDESDEVEADSANNESDEVPPCDDSEKILEKQADLLKAAEIEQPWPVDPDECDLCHRSFARRKYWIDGKLKNDMLWANMCSGCFLQRGEGIGWGKGQLFARQLNGEWLLVGGFPR